MAIQEKMSGINSGSGPGTAGLTPPAPFIAKASHCVAAFLSFSLLMLAGPTCYSATISTGSIKTDMDAIEALSLETEGKDAKFIQDYLYSGNDGIAALGSRTAPLRMADPGPSKTPTAEYTAKTAVIRADSAKKVPPMADPLAAALKADAASGLVSPAKTTTLPLAKIGEKIAAAFSRLGEKISSGLEKGKGWLSDKLLGEGRPLTEEETAAARQSFGDKLDYSKVKIVTGENLTWFADKVLTKSYRFSDGKITSGPAGVTLGNRIYFPNDSATGKTHYSFSTGSAWFIHEMTHTYQYNTQGIKYMFKSMIGQMKQGDDFYKYQLESGKAFSEYNVEQQARLVEHYHQIVNGKRRVTPEERALYEEILGGAGFYPSDIPGK